MYNLHVWSKLKLTSSNYLTFQANADPSVISCMYNLSRRIAIALQHEERRCQYLTREAKLMLAVQDEITTMAEREMRYPAALLSSDAHAHFDNIRSVFSVVSKRKPPVSV